MKTPRHILICRTDSIGDVVLTLPLAVALKKHFPQARITFLGQSYTRPVIACCESVDEVLEWDAIYPLPPEAQQKQIEALGIDTVIHVFPDKNVVRLCYKAGIPMRIATGRRSFTWFYCNKKVFFSRKKSELHEAQLNFKLLAPLGIREIPDVNNSGDLYRWRIPDTYPEPAIRPVPGKFNLILHPRSKGSAREWGLENFGELIRLLPADKFEIFISGTAAEGAQIAPLLQNLPAHVHDCTGRFSLPEFIRFISRCQGLVAASTGPLHIAAACGIHALGIFSPMRPIHPGRWKPLGKHATYFVKDADCEGCQKGKSCECIAEIPPSVIAAYLEGLTL